MHVVFRESHGLEETATPRDLGQRPADLVVLSFSDSDLGAFAAGWHAARGGGVPLPSLRLANLADLAHPLSVDTYVERTLAGAKGILIRLIGGRSYWSYGLQQVEALARSADILRVKGYAAVAGKPMRLLVQAVGARVRTQYDRLWRADEPRRTQLVVIAEHDRIDAVQIKAALDA